MVDGDIPWQWNPEDPSDMSRWETQHEWLDALGPPYVYNVLRGDKEGFVRAVKAALSHPIDRYARQTIFQSSWLMSEMYSYVLERMTMPAVEKRLAAILEKDWYREADLFAVNA